MSAIFSPTSSTGTPPTGTEAAAAVSLTEFIGTAGTTVSLLPPPAVVGSEEVTTYEYNIISVTMNDEHAPTDLVVTKTADTFTFTSTFPDMFDRQIKYLVYDADNDNVSNNRFLKTYLQVPRFQDLPEKFTGVYQYVPPSVNTREVNFTVVYDETTSIVGGLGGLGGGTTRLTETWSFTIVENWQLAMQYLKLSISNGTRAKRAVAKYPELSL